MTTTTCPTCSTPGIGDAASCDHGFGDLLARHALLIEAYGNAPALAAVRRTIAESIGHACAALRDAGVDVDAWLDEIDDMLDPYRDAARAGTLTGSIDVTRLVRP